METTWSGLSAKKEPCCGSMSKKTCPPKPFQFCGRILTQNHLACAVWPPKLHLTCP